MNLNPFKKRPGPKPPAWAQELLTEIKASHRATVEMLANAEKAFQALTSAVIRHTNVDNLNAEELDELREHLDKRLDEIKGMARRAAKREYTLTVTPLERPPDCCPYQSPDLRTR